MSFRYSYAKNLANPRSQHIADFGELSVYRCDDGEEENRQKGHGSSVHRGEEEGKGLDFGF